ncbi:MAG: bacillithiol biosynthesis cysteine-adding enzyme BshC [Acidobacteria bacterium]|nr:bacillithiol biosynthesis cysteine-adding enzyme BshC [Acidobacteriota bacterium]
MRKPPSRAIRPSNKYSLSCPGHTMAKSVGLSFERIPKTPALLVDYLYHAEKVQSFFPGLSASAFSGRPGPGGPWPHLAHRAALVETLRRQNRRWGASAKTMENLDRLAGDHCRAVVTGQQVGLFTGPAYTIYKALTAVKLAEAYRRRGVEAVPLFWMATEDHDLEEVGRTWNMAADSTLESVQFAQESEGNRFPVGPIALGPSIADHLDRFLQGLPDSEFKPVLAARLKRVYREGNTFGEAFAEVVSFLLSEYGLILLDPQEPSLKKMARPVFLQAVEAWEKLDELLGDRNRQLAGAGYSPQVSREAGTSFLFWEQDGKRRGVVGTRGGFSLRGNGEPLPDFPGLVERAPEQVSPNVLFRPVVQDFLLPTLAYVAGPSEVAYHAQISPLYHALGRVMPPVVPRAGFTVIERRMQKLLAKYRLEFCDLFGGSQALLQQIVEGTVNQEVGNSFDRLQCAIDRRLGEMEGALKSVDPTLVGALETARKKIQYQLENLRSKFVSAESRRRGILTRQVNSLLTTLYPSGGFQERQINIFYFLSRYGPEFLDELYDAIDLSDPDHKLIYL